MGRPDSSEMQCTTLPDPIYNLFRMIKHTSATKYLYLWIIKSFTSIPSQGLNLKVECLTDFENRCTYIVLFNYKQTAIHQFILHLIQRPARCPYGHLRVDGMSKVRATYHLKLMTLAIPMYCVKKSNRRTVCEKCVICSPRRCRTECCILLKTPEPQNGTMAKGALLMEKFISAECVR